MSVPLAHRTEPIPGYRLIERLGRGGFGEVWKCEAPGGILKAIKFVYGDLEGAGEDGKGAEQELKALARVKQVRHPYILSLERYDIVEGQLMIVMELADRNLWDRFRECRASGLPGIPREELLRYMEECSEALDMMNEQHNLQHLDIKPQNLFLVYNHVKVADFGLVKDFEGIRGTVTGGVTPVYAAPETFEGWISRHCDQYSLAIVFQELLTGQRPFNGANTRQLLLQHIQGVPDVSSLPEGDRAAIAKALAKKPEERFASCSELTQALRGGPSPHTPMPPRALAVDTLPAVAPPPSTIAPTLPRTPSPAMPPSTLTSPTPAQPTRGRLTMPADVTQAARPSAPVTLQRADFLREIGSSPDLATVAPPDVTGDGVLMPALLVGLGGAGGAVVRAVRDAIAERFGSPNVTAPHVRSLIIDTDTSPGDDGPPTYHARLNRPSHYLKRDSSPGCETWLNPQMLYRIPRHPTTGGLRAFGRLAFWDHQRALLARLKAELDAALDPAALAESERRTGLTLRTSRPRVYVVAGLAGGTGSGMMIDVAYLLRHLLREAGYDHADVRGVLLAPPVERSGSRTLAVGNAYAALVEMLHFSQPGSVYTFTPDPKARAVQDGERPFHRCLLLPWPSGSDAAERKQAARAASGLLFRDLFAPLGRAIDEELDDYEFRHPPQSAFCQTAAAFRLSWPRERLLDHAAVRLGQHLLAAWTTRDASPLTHPVRDWLEDQWVRRQLPPETLIERLQEACFAALGQSPEAKFGTLVEPLAERTVLGTRMDARSACESLDKLVQLVGKPSTEPDDGRASLLTEALGRIAREVASECEEKLAEMAVYFIEMPQYRLAGAEEALRQLTEKLDGVFRVYEELHGSLEREATEVYAKLFPLIGSLNGFSLGNRKAMVAAEVLELLRAYPQKRYQAMVAQFVMTIYRGMLASAPEYLRELNFCRQRLEDVGDRLAERVRDDDGSASPLGPGAYVFAGGDRTLDDAAARLIDGLTADDLLDLDQRVQAQVRKQFRAVVSLCLEQGVENTSALADLLVEQPKQYLATRLPKQHPAETFFEGRDGQASQRAVQHAYEETTLDLAGPRNAAEGEVCLLAAPDTSAGRKFRELAGRVIAGVELLPAPSDGDLVFHREQRGLVISDLPQLGPAAREAYFGIAQQEGVSLHSRDDVVWQPGR